MKINGLRWIVLALIAIVTIIAFMLGMRANDATAQTMAFAVLCLSRLFHGFNCRSEYSLKHIGFMSNRYSIAAFLAGFFASYAFSLPTGASIVAVHMVFYIAAILIKAVRKSRGGRGD